MRTLNLKFIWKNLVELDFIILVVIAILLFFLFYILASVKEGKISIQFQRNKLVFGIIAASYVAVLLQVMLLNRTRKECYEITLIPFWSYKEYFESKRYMLLIQMIYNVLAFIPWPILFAKVFPIMRKFLWSIGSAFLFSLFIETMQLIFKLGMFEFDDMFHNVMGALIGYGILMFWEKMRKNDRN